MTEAGLIEDILIQIHEMKAVPREVAKVKERRREKAWPQRNWINTTEVTSDNLALTENSKSERKKLSSERGAMRDLQSVRLITSHLVAE